MDIPDYLQMKLITKVYSNGIIANNKVNFSLKRGEIHGLIGENGAGKTTLMKILFGLEQPDQGDIYLNGEIVNILSPTVAISNKIGMVHQHFMLVPSLTVVENLILGNEPDYSGIFINRKKSLQIANKYAKKYSLIINPSSIVRDITVAMMQKVEILKALIRGADILILDEPTAVLTTQETSELFIELTHLKAEGHTIIFISHKLKEIKKITDRLTIMKEGKSIGVYKTSELSEKEISKLMIGRETSEKLKKVKSIRGELVLKVSDIEYTNKFGKKVLNGISFSIRQGEILGVAGVEGNGQRELIDILVGLTNPDKGFIKVNDESVIGKKTKDIRKLGVAFIPEDRLLYGVAGNCTILENLISDRYYQSNFSNGIFLDMDAIRKESEKLITKYNISCSSIKQKVNNLSGGNIQKVVVARELSSNPKLVIADQPTRGIDIGTTDLIHNQLNLLRTKGTAILLISAEIKELFKLSDSIIVMFNGQIVAFFKDISRLTDILMGEYMLGIKHQSNKETRRAIDG